MLAKLIGKKISYFLRTEQLKRLWVSKGTYQTLALGNDYWLFKFSNIEDIQHVLHQGPWMAYGHYL